MKYMGSKKRINRKEVIETLEFARSGFLSASIEAERRGDAIMKKSFDAHYRLIEKQIRKLIE